MFFCFYWILCLVLLHGKVLAGSWCLSEKRTERERRASPALKAGSRSSPEKQATLRQDAPLMLHRLFQFSPTHNQRNPLISPQQWCACATCVSCLAAPAGLSTRLTQLVALVPPSRSTTTNHKRSSSTTQPSSAPHSVHHLLQLLHQLFRYSST